MVVRAACRALAPTQHRGMAARDSGAPAASVARSAHPPNPQRHTPESPPPRRQREPTPGDAHHQVAQQVPAILQLARHTHEPAADPTRERRLWHEPPRLAPADPRASVVWRAPAGAAPGEMLQQVSRRGVRVAHRADDRRLPHPRSMVRLFGGDVHAQVVRLHRVTRHQPSTGQSGLQRRRARPNRRA